MFNDPPYASAEEWDVYAWFGFTVSEAQFIERQLLVVAVALDSLKSDLPPADPLWSKMYDDLGQLGLGQLLSRIRKHQQIPEELVNLLNDAVARRNALAHEFFWPRGPGADGGICPQDAIKRLQADATLFEHLGGCLEPFVLSLIDTLHLKRQDVEAKAAAAVSRVGR